MNELAAQKRLLVLESELNRRALRMHGSDIKDGVERAQHFVQMGRATSPLLVFAVSAGAFLMFRKRKTLTGLAGKALSGWQLLQTLKLLWTSFIEGQHAVRTAMGDTSSVTARQEGVHE